MWGQPSRPSVERSSTLVLDPYCFISASQFNTSVTGEETPCSTRTDTRIRPSVAVSSGYAPPGDMNICRGTVVKLTPTYAKLYSEFGRNPQVSQI